MYKLLRKKKSKVMYSWSNQIKASLLYNAHWLDHKSCPWHQTQFCQICHFLTIVSRHCFSSRLQMLIHRSTQAYSMRCDGPSSFYSNKAQTQLLFVVKNLFRYKLGENPGFVRGVVVATSFPGSLFFPSSPVVVLKFRVLRISVHQLRVFCL